MPQTALEDPSRPPASSAGASLGSDRRPSIALRTEGLSALFEALSFSIYVGLVVRELLASRAALGGFAASLVVSAVAAALFPRAHDTLAALRIAVWIACSVPAASSESVGGRVLLAGAAFGVMAAAVRRALYRGPAPRFHFDPTTFLHNLPGRLAEAAALTGIVAGHILMLFAVAFMRARASQFRVAWFDVLPFLAATASVVFALVVRRRAQPIVAALRAGRTGDETVLRAGLLAAEGLPTYLAVVNFALWGTCAVITTSVAPRATGLSGTELVGIAIVALLFGSGVAIHQRAFQRSILVPAVKRLRAWVEPLPDERAPESLRTRLVVDFALPVVSVCMLFLLATVALYVTLVRERGGEPSWVEVLPIVAACVVVTFAATTLTIRSAEDLARPINELAAATIRVASGATAEPLPPLAGPREVVAMARSAEQMRTSLVHTIADLDAERASLERRVDERARELRTALLDLGQAQAALVHGEKMASLGHLVANVAHEINNPLSAVKGAVSPIPLAVDELRGLVAVLDEAIARLPEDERRAFEDRRRALAPDDALRDLLDAADLVTRAAGRAARIVDGLRRFSRASEAAVPALLEEGLDETLAILGPSLREHQIEVERDFAGLAPLVCRAGELNQVFLNLLANAIGAVSGRSPARIRIGTSENGGAQVVVIEDNGPGISAELRSRIFEPFFTTKAAGEGTGLGLSISRQIVVRHGGEVEVASSDLGGARFVVRLPVAGGSPPNGAGEARGGA